MSDRIEFIVHGKPVPKGSKRGFVVGKRVAIADDNSEPLQQWYGAVTSAAAEAMGDNLLWCGPVRLSVVFYFKRPKGHFGTGKNADTLKPSAPERHTKKPDLDKLLRTIQDALTSTVYRDDSQVCEYGVLTKQYGTPERAEIMIEDIGRPF